MFKRETEINYWSEILKLIKACKEAESEDEKETILERINVLYIKGTLENG
jgi:hypothetical protein